MVDDTPQKRRRGFARLPPEQRREMAQRGGRGVAAEDRGFAKNRAAAVEAGRKGGLNVAPEKRSFFINRQLAVNAGRKGGRQSQRRRGGKSL